MLADQAVQPVTAGGGLQQEVRVQQPLQFVERAEALLDGDRKALLAMADVFDAAGCRYQAARALVLAGGDHASCGASALTALGLTT
ncbi:hypothetical protein ACWDR1_02090 [Streptosporangium sandarakinum]